MNFEFKKRLIGAEDINFDTTGTGERADFKDFFGNTKTLHKINASHLPLSATARKLIGSKNVDEALQILFNKEPSQKDEPDNEEKLQADKTVTFSNTDNEAAINTKIKKELKNLNNYTLTFEFAENISMALLKSICWENFKNGTLIVNGKDASISDPIVFKALFEFKNCDCNIEIKNFVFNVKNSISAILLENCPRVKISNCSFDGSNNAGASAVSGVIYDGYFNNCIFNNIITAVKSEQSLYDITADIQFCKVKTIDSEDTLTVIAEDGKTYSLKYNKTQWGN